MRVAGGPPQRSPDKSVSFGAKEAAPLRDRVSLFENMNKTKAHRTLSRRDGVISPAEMKRLKAALAELDDLDERVAPEEDGADWDASVRLLCFVLVHGLVGLNLDEMILPC